tara:strand:- start:550 stop:1413 length:864 start_codon:yes stop_codon:yes gene_type:complete
MIFTYLNDQFIPKEEVKISPFDRGFLFGDAVYEVIPVYKNGPFLLDEHLRRLETSLTKVNIQKPKKWNQLVEILKEMIKRNSFNSQYLYLQISRGQEDTRNHTPSTTIEPTLFIFSAEFAVNPFRKDFRKSGLIVITKEDLRWQRCDIKAVTLLANITELFEAKDLGADEVIFHEGKRVTEGASSNIFAVLNKKIVTPPLSNKILPGVTRNYVITLIKDLNLDFEEQDLTIKDLYEAHEIWLTSSTKEIQPISKIDEIELPIKDPKRAYWKVVLDAFDKRIKSKSEV